METIVALEFNPWVVLASFAIIGAVLLSLCSKKGGNDE